MDLLFLEQVKHIFLIEGKLSKFKIKRQIKIEKKIVIHNGKPLYYFFFWRMDEMSHQLTLWPKILEEIQKQKLNWENWNSHQGNKDIHVYFSWARTLGIQLSQFAILFQRFVWKKIVYSNLDGNYKRLLVNNLNSHEIIISQEIEILKVLYSWYLIIKYAWVSL